MSGHYATSIREATKSFWRKPVSRTIVLRKLRRVTSAPTGKDATEAFEDVGHSDEARALLKDMLVGDFEKTDVRNCYQ